MPPLIERIPVGAKKRKLRGEWTIETVQKEAQFYIGGRASAYKMAAKVLRPKNLIKLNHFKFKFKEKEVFDGFV